MPLFRRVVIALLAAAIVALLWWMRAGRTPASAPQSSTAPVAAPAMPGAAAAKNISVAANASAGPADSESGFERITVADSLGAPEGNIQHDITILVTLFESWRTFFPADGNPWGNNAEITAMLLGKNRRKLVFLDRTHRAINADGELCDRWGTPFRFHALTGDRMEIRSAGPDKQFGTADDAVFMPP